MLLNWHAGIGKVSYRADCWHNLDLDYLQAGLFTRCPVTIGSHIVSK